MNLKNSAIALGLLTVLLLILQTLVGRGAFVALLYVGIAVVLISTVVALFVVP